MSETTSEKPYRLDPMFAGWLPIQTVEAYRQLKEEIRNDGRVRDGLVLAVIAGEEGLPILCDGYTRDRIVDELRAEGVEISNPPTCEKAFPTREAALNWMFSNQDARRNWGPADKAAQILRNESLVVELRAAAAERQRTGTKSDGDLGNHGSQGRKKGGRVAHALADLAGVSHKTIKQVATVIKHPEIAAQMLDPDPAQRISISEAHRQAKAIDNKANRDQASEQARLDRPPYRYDPAADGFENQILQGDNLDLLKTLPDGSVHLTFFSPPYPTSLVHYDTKEAEYSGVYKSWLRDLLLRLREISRATADGGRVVINIDQTSETLAEGSYKRNVRHDVERLARRAGLMYMDTICWAKQKTIGSKGSINWGSFRSASSPRVRRSHEDVLVFAKGSLVRPDDNGADDCSHEDFVHATISVYNYDYKTQQPAENTVDSFWYVSPAKRDGSHPCPFPLKLAELVISVWSRRGDLILDPYAGSGTTCVAAHRLGRRFCGMDISPDYCGVAQQRLREQQKELDKQQPSQQQDNEAA